MITVTAWQPLAIPLMHKWEGCEKQRPDGRYGAYPDPGSADGHPWTIGYGSTGKGITRGTIWTKQQCEERFAEDLIEYGNEVARFLGDAPTTAHQFAALVCFHYNTGAIRKASLVTAHKVGDYEAAARGFGKWIYNDGKVMRGLINRRADEATLYSKQG